MCFFVNFSFRNDSTKVVVMPLYDTVQDFSRSDAGGERWGCGRRGECVGLGGALADNRRLLR
jgi:hypothetical protein